MTDADALLAASRRPLVIGVGGGGDVVGALATAESCRLHGASPVVGGTTWERRPIDPRPGPRLVAEIAGGRPLAGPVLAAGPDTHVGGEDTLFAESHMARFLGEEVVLVDPNPGPVAVADGLRRAMSRLEADLLVVVDVGGDALAGGGEPGLASPLCDALMLAAAARVADGGELAVLGGVFGMGCDGELTPDEVLERLGQIAAVGGLAGIRGLTEPVASRLEAAVAEVPTEASAQAVRAFRGQLGTTRIRGGQRRVELSLMAAATVFFDVTVALSSAARLAAAVSGARDLEDANDRLNELGVRTELDAERGPPPTSLA